MRGGAEHRGQGLVEVALVLPIVVLVLMGIFDLGRAVYAYNTISNAAREAMRTAIVNQDAATVTDRAVAHAVALGTSGADVDVAYLTPDLAGPCTSVAIGCVAEVTVHYQFVAITPLLGNIIGPLDLQSTSRALVENATGTP